MRYPPNLSDLPKHEQEKIEREKAAWLECHTTLRTLSADQIKNQLEKITCPLEREDLRQKLRLSYKYMLASKKIT